MPDLAELAAAQAPPQGLARDQQSDQRDAIIGRAFDMMNKRVTLARVQGRANELATATGDPEAAQAQAVLENADRMFPDPAQYEQVTQKLREGIARRQAVKDYQNEIEHLMSQVDPETGQPDYTFEEASRRAWGKYGVEINPSTAGLSSFYNQASRENIAANREIGLNKRAGERIGAENKRTDAIIDQNKVMNTFRQKSEDLKQKIFEAGPSNLREAGGVADLRAELRQIDNAQQQGPLTQKDTERRQYLLDKIEEQAKLHTGTETTISTNPQTGENQIRIGKPQKGAAPGEPTPTEVTHLGTAVTETTNLLRDLGQLRLDLQSGKGVGPIETVANTVVDRLIANVAPEAFDKLRAQTRGQIAITKIGAVKALNNGQRFTNRELDQIAAALPSTGAIESPQDALALVNRMSQVMAEKTSRNVERLHTQYPPELVYELAQMDNATLDDHAERGWISKDAVAAAIRYKLAHPNLYNRR